MNPKQFLLVGGIVLLAVGILGFIGIIGPDSESLFGSAWFFDNAENTAHTVLGIVALIVAYALSVQTHKPVTVLVGIIAILAGLYSLFGPVTEGANLLGAQLQNPADTILHIVLGIWAFWAGFRKV